MHPSAAACAAARTYTTHKKNMTTREEYEQLRAFARIDGAIVGGLWIVSFAFFIGEFSYPVLANLALLAGVASIVTATLRLKRFRDNVLDGVITFGRALLYGMLVYFYASLLMAAAQFVYFQFIDQGFLMTQYATIVSTPEFKSMIKAYGMRPEDTDLIIDNISALRPIDIALQFFSLNIIMGFCVSLPVAVMLKSKYKRKL